MARAMASAWLSVRPRRVGDLESGIAQRGAQTGMIAVTQPRFDGLENPSGLLVLFVGDAVQGGGDGWVAVCPGGQG